MENTMLLKKDLKEKRELINITLDRFLPRKDEYPKEIHKAMRHSLFAGGKRLRPYLTIRAFNLFDDDTEKVRSVAAAIEMLHTYSLIHDDLPSIDNDDYRRGKKTCHVVFGEDLALLAGDALITCAFELLTEAQLDEALRVKMVHEMASDCGAEGLIAGQMMDIVSAGKKVTKSTLEYIHHNKTGKLIRLAVRFGCYVANAPEEDVTRLDEYGSKLGLAFQIVDDILDEEGSSSSLGKTVGKDKAAEKATFPAVYGMDKSRDMARKLVDEAHGLLDTYGDKALMLHLLTDFVLNRKF